MNDQSVVGLTLYDLNNLIKQAKDPVTFKTVKEGYILMLYVAIQCHISYMKKHHANTHWTTWRHIQYKPRILFCIESNLYKILKYELYCQGKFLFTHYLHVLVLRSKSPSSMCAKLRTVAASNNKDHPMRSLSLPPLVRTINCSPGSQALSKGHSPRSLHYCLFAPHLYGVVLCAHSVHGEPRISAQRQQSGCKTCTAWQN